jgi:putative Mg2+ transporter-C (MgtC) family protein
MHVLSDIPFFVAGWQVAVWRLVAAFVAGAILGLDREHRERPAGLRTHVLVCLTSCLSMAAILAMSPDTSTPSRVAQGVLTGIGFLGAGTIMRYGVTVRGLTTAASIWSASAVGLALGAGWYLGAVLALVLVMVALVALRGVEHLLHRDGGPLHLEATLAAGTAFPQGLLPMLEANGVELLQMDVTQGPPAIIRLALEPTAQLAPAAVLALVQSAPGVTEAELVERGTWKVKRGERER